MTDRTRMRGTTLLGKVMSADEAAALIQPGANIGMSGFTGAGYPKAVPMALVRRITEATARGERFVRRPSRAGRPSLVGNGGGRAPRARSRPDLPTGRRAGRSRTGRRAVPIGRRVHVPLDHR